MVEKRGMGLHAEPLPPRDLRGDAVARRQRIRDAMDDKGVSVRELQRAVAAATDNARGSGISGIRKLLSKDNPILRPRENIVAAVATILDEDFGELMHGTARTGERPPGVPFPTEELIKRLYPNLKAIGPAELRYFAAFVHRFARRLWLHGEPDPMTSWDEHVTLVRLLSRLWFFPLLPAYAVGHYPDRVALWRHSNAMSLSLDAVLPWGKDPGNPRRMLEYLKTHVRALDPSEPPVRDTRDGETFAHVLEQMAAHYRVSNLTENAETMERAAELCRSFVFESLDHTGGPTDA